MTTSPLRAAPLFGCTEISTTPLSLPLDPYVMLIQLARLDAFQLHPVVAETATRSSGVPAAATRAVVGFNEKRHGAPA